MSADDYEIQTFKVLDFFRQHPGLVISLSYVLLTVCGIFYSWSFYKEFDVAILKLANISDLLTAGVSEPAAILMFLGGFVVAIATEYMSYHSHRLYQKWKSKPNGILRSSILIIFRTPTKNSHLMAILIIVFILYAHLFVSKYAEWQSRQIKQGVGDRIIISSEALEGIEQEMLLLGSTTNFVLGYSLSKGEVSIIPVENISKMRAMHDINDKASTQKITSKNNTLSDSEQAAAKSLDSEENRQPKTEPK